jgi:hypothetical protein
MMNTKARQHELNPLYLELQKEEPSSEVGGETSRLSL